jgi:ribosomal protein L11 methyltransferase
VSGGTWTSVEIRPRLGELASEDWAASCMDALSELGCLGTEERGSGADLRVVAWLPAASDASRVATLLQQVAALLREAGLGGDVLGAGSVEDPGWVEQFNASLKPVHVGKRLTILPRPGEAPEGRVALVIEPGRAFGTGHHESTRLALEHLEEILRPGASVLDVGTGSGVLALAAVRLGAARAVGIDVDPEAVEVATENVAGQPEEARIELFTCDDPALVPGTFDVVLANIQADVLHPMLPALRGRIAPGGRLILSGLLLGDREPMDRALAACGLRAAWKQDGEWASACAAPA